MFPQRETDEYSSCFDGSDSALSSHLTKEELEHYTRIYEEKSTSQISLTEKSVPSHQHQTSYAQSEGYHSYVSSTDSTSTPFLDRYIILYNIIGSNEHPFLDIPFITQRWTYLQVKER